MKTFTHRYLLPPILVSIHALFLIPILVPTIAKQQERSQTSATNSNSSDHDVSDTPDDTITLPPTLPQTLNFEHAIYFGVASFAFVYILKQIAGRIPLPASRSRRKLAIWMELVILFGMGALEEIWRWGVVQYLVATEIGDWESDKFGSARHIWRTIYAAGWVWSLVECAFSWWGFRPDGNDEEESPKLQQSPRSSHRTRPRRTFSQLSVPVLNSRKSPPPNRRDSLTALRRGSVLAFPGDENPFMNNSQSRTITWQSGTEGNRSTASLLSGDGTAGRSDERADTPLFGEAFQFPSPSTRPFSAFVENRLSPQVSGEVAPNAATSPRQDGATTDLSNFPARHLEDSDFGDDEDDTRSVNSFSSMTSSLRSSLDTSRGHAGAETPLLSSSLQYDEHHHHHESHSLLNNQARRMSYHTMTTNGLHPVYSEDDEEETHITVRDYDYDLEDQHPPNGGTVTFQESDLLLHQDQRREYPSFSAQYNSSHFSLYPDRSFAESSSSTTAIPPRSRPSSAEHAYQRLLYGVSVNSLSPILPIVWRTSALLRHLACTLLFGFFPALVKKDGGIQWWTVCVVLVIASLKGWYTVEWLGGNVARSGVAKVTVVTAVVSVVGFLAVLGLWHIL